MRLVVLLLVAVGCRAGFDPAGDRDGAVAIDTDPFVGDSNSGDSVGANCPTGYVALAGQTSRYRAVDNSNTWTQAEALCEADGTHLVVLDSSGESTAVAMTLPGNNIWTGVTDRKVIGTWLRVTGGVATYLPWDSSEPDATAPECVFLDGVSLGVADQDCLSGRRPVCECDGLLADPTTY